MLSVSVIAPYNLTPDRLDAIQAFRGSVYGDIPAVTDGRNVDRHDADSWHVVLFSDSEIIGAARYYRKGSGLAELGGFCVKRRGTRDAARIVAGISNLAEELGDVWFIAHASDETGSGSILRKLGGEVLAEYYNEQYQNKASLILIARTPSRKRVVCENLLFLMN